MTEAGEGEGYLRLLARMAEHGFDIEVEPPGRRHSMTRRRCTVYAEDGESYLFTSMRRAECFLDGVDYGKAWAKEHTEEYG